MKRLIVCLNFILIVAACPLAGYAGEPLETIQSQVHDILNVIQDPALTGDSAQSIKIDKIRSTADIMFDYNELSMRTLGRDWKRLNPEQREEFVHLYTALLEKVYMDRILASTDQKVVFTKESILSENRAEVYSDIVSDSATVSMHYRMILKNGEWKVYDVVIEGVSLIENYRSQFRQILTNKAPEELLKILREKIVKA